MSPEPLKRAAWLAAAYPGRSIDELHIASWAEVLAPLTEHEVDDVIGLLRLRAPDPPSVAQISQCIREVQEETMSPALPMAGHVFLEETECPVCLSVHGEMLDGGQILHGAHHLANGERESADRPERCDCGFDVPSNINPMKVVEMVRDDMMASWG